MLPFCFLQNLIYLLDMFSLKWGKYYHHKNSVISLKQQREMELQLPV